MNPTEGIVVKTFGNIADADLAAGQLRGHGIECAINTDDCGGMYPSLGVIQLLVDPEKAEDARKVLKESDPGSGVSVSLPDSSAPSPAPPPRVFRFNSGLVVGIVIGLLIHISYSKYVQHRDGTDKYDRDGDGISEEEQVWRGGENVETRLDRNGDQRVDWWIHYRNNLITQEEVDDNFDGKPDGWVMYSQKGFPIRAEIDSDCNGVRDATITYTNGVAVQTDWRPNGTNVVLLRQRYHHSVLVEELRDLNGDGWFDVSIKFDAFNTPVSTNSLRPTTQTP